MRNAASGTFCQICLTQPRDTHQMADHKVEFAPKKGGPNRQIFTCKNHIPAAEAKATKAGTYISTTSLVPSPKASP